MLLDSTCLAKKLSTEKIKNYLDSNNVNLSYLGLFNAEIGGVDFYKVILLFFLNPARYAVDFKNTVAACGSGIRRI